MSVASSVEGCREGGLSFWFLLLRRSPKREATLPTPFDRTTPVTRLDRHNEGLSTYTRKFRPWKLLVSIEFADTKTADQ